MCNPEINHLIYKDMLRLKTLSLLNTLCCLDDVVYIIVFIHIFIVNVKMYYQINLSNYAI